jgi:hypothetical protein
MPAYTATARLTALHRITQLRDDGRISIYSRLANPLRLTSPRGKFECTFKPLGHRLPPSMTSINILLFKRGQEMLRSEDKSGDFLSSLSIIQRSSPTIDIMSLPHRNDHIPTLIYLTLTALPHCTEVTRCTLFLTQLHTLWIVPSNAARYGSQFQTHTASRLSQLNLLKATRNFT